MNKPYLKVLEEIEDCQRMNSIPRFGAREERRILRNELVERYGLKKFVNYSTEPCQKIKVNGLGKVHLSELKMHIEAGERKHEWVAKGGSSTHNYQYCEICLQTREVARRK